MARSTDEAWWTGVGAWERDGDRSIVLPRLDLLYRLAVRFTGDEATADRLVLETVRRALDGSGEVTTDAQPTVALAALLHETYVNRIADAHNGGVPGLTEPGPPPPPILREQLRQEDAQELIFRALDAMPFALREVLVLRDLEGFDDASVARITDLAVPAVQARLRAARIGLEKRVGRLLQPERFPTSPGSL